MYNRFTAAIVKRVMEHAPAVVLANLTGESDRIWRDRLQTHWEPSEEQRARLDEASTAMLVEQLIERGGWSVDEARAILAGLPSAQAGTAMPTADLIHACSPRYGAYCREAIGLARRFDQDCYRLDTAVRAANFDTAQLTLCAMLDWLLGFVTELSDRTDPTLLHAQLVQATDMDGLLRAAAPLGNALAFHVLSCWDVEFCAGYFEGTMQAYPLFSLVMPRFAAGLNIEPETGRLLRKGRVARQRVLEPAMARLIDFVAVLIAWQRDGALPQRLPGPKDLSEWCDEDLARVYSWRDGSTRFTPAQLERLWAHALTPDSAGMYPEVPTPMLICAHLWSPLLAHENNSVSLIDCTADYQHYWRANHDRLVSGGLRFGEQAWPAYFVQRTGDAIVAEIRSRQSAGRAA